MFLRLLGDDGYVVLDRVWVVNVLYVNAGKVDGPLSIVNGV